MKLFFYVLYMTHFKGSNVIELNARKNISLLLKESCVRLLVGTGDTVVSRQMWFLPPRA